MTLTQQRVLKISASTGNIGSNPGANSSADGLKIKSVRNDPGVSSGARASTSA